MPKSYKPEYIADSSGTWADNALRFETRQEAEGNAKDLAGRWLLVREWRVSESDDEPNYRWDNEKGLMRLQSALVEKE